jgi:hypothetical protein
LEHIAGQNNIKGAYRSFENVTQYLYLGTTVRNQNFISGEKEEIKFR